MFKKLIVGMLFVTTVANVSAEVIDLKFTDTAGNLRVLNRDAVYINPVSAVTFSITGGLDRRINLVLKNTSGEVLYESTTSKINTDDLFTIKEKNYFGKLIPLSFPSDGDYTVEANMLSYNGNIVQTDNYLYTVDTVAPVITGETRYTPNSVRLRTYNASFANSNFLHLSIEGLSDNDVIDKANILVQKDVKNSSLGRLSAKINEDASKAFFTEYPSSLITGDGHYTVGFEVFDRAGNVGTSTSGFIVDNIMPEVLFSHVYNPNTDNWDDYVPGMTVYSNPAKIKVRRKKIDHPTFNGDAAIGWDTSAFDFEDENYIYTELPVFTPNNGSYKVFNTKTSMIKVVHGGQVDIVMAEGVPLAPKGANVSYRLNGSGDYNVQGSSARVRISSPTTITETRVKVKLRTYEQTVVVKGGGSCIIPALQEECTVSTNYIYDSGRGYHAKRISVFSSVDGVLDGKFGIHIGHVLIYYDFNGGEFLSHNIEKNKIKFTYLDPDNTNSKWYTPQVQLHAKNTLDNTVKLINTIEYGQIIRTSYKGVIDTSVLTEGRYDFSLVATDSYGNETKESVAKNILIDNTAPKITIMDKGLESFGEVFGLDNIDIILEDIDTAAITEIILKEGPLNNVVNMSWREIENKSFKLEYPKIFPSLTDDEKYKLIVKANDSSGNTSEKEITFIYKPLELREKEPINIITTTEPLRNKEGTIVNLIKEKNIRNRDGILVTGPYLADFTLSSSSEFSVSIMARTSGITGSRNEIVNPGQTIRVPIMLTEGELKFGITQVAKQEGTIKYLLEILDI